MKHTCWLPVATALGGGLLGACSAPSVPEALHAPLFPEAVLVRAAGDVRIEARGAAADASYVQALEVNGRPHDRAWVDWSELASGGTLSFRVAPEPNEEWGVVEAPPSHPAPVP